MASIQPSIAIDQSPKFVRPVEHHADGNAKFAVVQIVGEGLTPPSEFAKHYPPGQKLITTFPAYGIAMHFAYQCKKFSRFDAAEFIVVGLDKVRTFTR